jgi:hypothetical protein
MALTWGPRLQGTIANNFPADSAGPARERGGVSSSEKLLGRFRAKLKVRPRRPPYPKNRLSMRFVMRGVEGGWRSQSAERALGLGEHCFARRWRSQMPSAVS